MLNMILFIFIISPYHRFIFQKLYFATQFHFCTVPVPRQTSQPSQGGYGITNSTKITLDKAIEIVVNKAGVSENDLYSKNANYDYDHGQYIVEVEIDTKSTECDAKIDALYRSLHQALHHIQSHQHRFQHQ